MLTLYQGGIDMRIYFVNIGLGNYVSASRILTVTSLDSAPVRRTLQQLRNQNMLIDATFGRITRSAIFLDSGHAVLSCLAPDTLSNRLNEKCGTK